MFDIYEGDLKGRGLKGLKNLLDIPYYRKLTINDINANFENSR